ncbi:MAG TPA: hypothetical protein VHE60_15095 [Pyrinomonadaceae bacterium]|nr:hypothetical protein [Pyrinomonadaceae bacterium]
MLTKTFLAFCLLCAFVLIGCSKTETMNNSNSTTGNSNKAGTTTTGSTSKASSTGDKIGVPECDDFIARYEACVSQAPEMIRAQLISAMKTWRDDWRKAASTPEGKAGLAAACKQAAEPQKAAMKPYCDF